MGLVDIFLAFSLAISFVVVMQLGALFNALIVYLGLGAVVMVARTVWLFAKKRTHFGAYRRLGDPKALAAVLSSAAAVAFAITACVVVRRAVPTAQFTEETYDSILLQVTLFAAVFGACALVPAKRPFTGFAMMHAGLVALLFIELGRYDASRETPKITIGPPFTEPFVILHGGPSKIFNHHYRARGQEHAVDLLVGPSFREGPTAARKEDTTSWGATIVSPLGGLVVAAEGSRPDVDLGDTDPDQPLGNHVIIQAADDRFVTLAHLQRSSLRVEVGDRVTAGQRLGACGNSGNTSEPHLHLQVQTKADPLAPESRSLPFAFAEMEEGPHILPRRNLRLTPTSTTARQAASE